MTDWDVQARTRAEMKNGLEAVAVEIMSYAAAGTKYTFSPVPREEISHWLEMRREDGLAVSFRLNTWKKRVEVDPSPPRHEEFNIMGLRAWGAVGYDEAPPSMSFAWGRDAKRVAAEVRRKVIEPYEPMFEGIQERRREFDRKWDAYEKGAAELAAALGTEARGHNRSDETKFYPTFPGYDGRQEFGIRSYGSAEIRITTDIDGAVALARFMRDRFAKAREAEAGPKQLQLVA